MPYFDEPLEHVNEQLFDLVWPEDEAESSHEAVAVPIVEAEEVVEAVPVDDRKAKQD